MIAIRIANTRARASAAVLAAALMASGSAAAGSVSTLYDFCASPNCLDGGEPGAGLVQDKAGNLYGTTTIGGAHGLGTVFTLIRNKAGTAWREKVLHSFSKSRGEGGPNGGLLMASSGALYGTAGAIGGGVERGGTVYELRFDKSKNRWEDTTLYKFCRTRKCPDGAQPNGSLVMSARGEIFGTTLAGGFRDNGTVFELTYDQAKAAWTERALYLFCRTPVKTICLDGTGPGGGLTLDQAGRLYGTTILGGAKNGGVLYELIPQSATSWTEAVLHGFCRQPSCTDGGMPVGGLLWDAAGQRLFGTATVGGAFSIDAGVVFETLRVTTGPWPFKVLHDFCSLGGCTDGFSPYSIPQLVIDKSGNLFGTTLYGGTGTSGGNGNGGGTVFELARGGQPPWQETVLYSFCAVGGFACSDGQQPKAGLLPVSGTSGKFYGATRLGGAHGGGTLFEVSQ